MLENSGKTCLKIWTSVDRFFHKKRTLSQISRLLFTLSVQLQKQPSSMVPAASPSVCSSMKGLLSDWIFLYSLNIMNLYWFLCQRSRYFVFQMHCFVGLISCALLIIWCSNSISYTCSLKSFSISEAISAYCFRCYFLPTDLQQRKAGLWTLGTFMSNKTRSRQFFAICFVPVGMIVEKYAMTENPLWRLLMT